MAYQEMPTILISEHINQLYYVTTHTTFDNYRLLKINKDLIRNQS